MISTPSNKTDGAPYSDDPVASLVHRFQCPGCLHGSNPGCGMFRYDPNELRCVAHVLGTIVRGGLVALGLPKGFCKPGFTDDGNADRNTMNIRLYRAGEHPAWDHLNVPVWALQDAGYLFVRTFAPRIDLSWVDVIEGGTLDMVPGAIDVANFRDSID